MCSLLPGTMAGVMVDDILACNLALRARVAGGAGSSSSSSLLPSSSSSSSSPPSSPSSPSLFFSFSFVPSVLLLRLRLAPFCWTTDPCRLQLVLAVVAAVARMEWRVLGVMVVCDEDGYGVAVVAGFGLLTNIITIDLIILYYCSPPDSTRLHQTPLDLPPGLDSTGLSVLQFG